MIEQLDSTTYMARVFKALADPTRLCILEFLRNRCCEVAVGEEGEVRPVDGPTFGEVCCHVTGRDKITTTVSFHLNELRDAGLINAEKRGRFMVCEVNKQALKRLALYLHEDESGSGENSCSERTER